MMNGKTSYLPILMVIAGLCLASTGFIYFFTTNGDSDGPSGQDGVHFAVIGDTQGRNHIFSRAVESGKSLVQRHHMPRTIKHPAT